MMQSRPSSGKVFAMALIKDKQAAEWLLIKEFCRDKIAEFHELNESPFGPEETNTLRGKIAFAKEILELEEVEGKPDVVDTEYRM